MVIFFTQDDLHAAAAYIQNHQFAPMKSNSTANPLENPFCFLVAGNDFWAQTTRRLNGLEKSVLVDRVAGGARRDETHFSGAQFTGAFCESSNCLCRLLNGGCLQLLRFVKAAAQARLLAFLPNRPDLPGRNLSYEKLHRVCADIDDRSPRLPHALRLARRGSG